MRVCQNWSTDGPKFRYFDVNIDYTFLFPFRFLFTNYVLDVEYKRDDVSF